MLSILYVLVVQEDVDLLMAVAAQTSSSNQQS